MSARVYLALQQQDRTSPHACELRDTHAIHLAGASAASCLDVARFLWRLRPCGMVLSVIDDDGSRCRWDWYEPRTWTSARAYQRKVCPHCGAPRALVAVGRSNGQPIEGKIVVLVLCPVCEKPYSAGEVTTQVYEAFARIASGGKPS